MRTRIFPQSNYKSVFINGKTIRIPIDRKKDITEIQYPEFYDISLGDKCMTGKCNYCYASGTPNGKRYSNIVEKARQFFGKMTLNERPYQVAIGGQSEPLEHPEFWEFCHILKELQIVPNYTTNGVLVNKKIADKTKEVCGGAAVTLHPHLKVFWERALKILAENGVRINIHVIISDKESVDNLAKVYEAYKGIVEYFVLLPYMNVGLAAGINSRRVEHDYLEQWLDGTFRNANIAVGSNFYNWVKSKVSKYPISIYPPEIFSKYLIMNDDMKVYNNSFDCKEVNWNNGVVIY